MHKQNVTTKQAPSGRRARLARLGPAVRAGMQSYGRILAYVRPYWLPLAASAISLVLIGLLSLAMPWAVQRLIDSVIVGQDMTQLNRIGTHPGRHLCRSRGLERGLYLPNLLGRRAGGRRPAA